MRCKQTILVAVILAGASLPAYGSPQCVKERTPFELSQDSVKWTMRIAPGADCIQGLRWSYMQIFNVAVVDGPTKGQLDIVGSGFRYAAENGNRGADKFTLLVTGKNRHTSGTSTVEVDVNPQP